MSARGRALTPQQLADFREEARGWLRENLPIEPFRSIDEPEGFEDHRKWEQALYDAGLAAVHWPEEFGGRGLDAVATAAFEEEYNRVGAPERLNIVGLHICGPTIMEYGTTEQQAQWLPDLLACRAVWSQGFSEPDAGSDLAAIRTSGEVHDGTIRVNGQKIWTSLGKWADWLLTLVRTDPDADKHSGLSLLVIDRHSPGVSVRPITQLTGEQSFAEVFFDDVVVPRENLVGPLNGGWGAAMALLAHERGPGVGSPATFERRLEEVLRIAEEVGAADNPYWRQQVAQHVADAQAYRWVWERDLELRARGAYPVEMASINKLLWTELDHQIAETVWAMLEDRAELLESASENIAHRDWNHDYWYSRAHQIAAGTTEINRNVVARRWLELPR